MLLITLGRWRAPELKRQRYVKMLSSYQLKILKEIGIDAWFERPRPSDNETGENKTSTKNISLRVIHCEKCVLLCSQSDEVFAKRFVKDLMSALTWRSTKSFADLGDYSHVDFSWPLLENSVDPEKALLAFVNEHNVFGGDRIVVASSEVLEAVDLILESIDVGIIKIPSWEEIMREGELKRVFWTSLFDD